MYGYDEDSDLTTGELDEIIAGERHEADMLQAQYEAEGRELDRLHAQGICTHGGGLGHRSPSFYSAEDIAAMFTNGHSRFGNRGGFAGEQSDIGVGNMLCTDCGEVVADPCPD